MTAIVAHDGGAADHVRMAVEILGHRMHDDVEAQRQRPLHVGRGERIVGHAQNAMLARQRRDRLQVGQLQAAGSRGVSIQIMRVLGRIAARKSSRFVGSTKLKSRFAERRRTRSNSRNEPP